MTEPAADAKPKVGARLLRALLVFASPAAVAVASLLIGIALAVGGVYLLAGPAWSLLAGATPFLLLAAVLIRGLTRAQ